MSGFCSVRLFSGRHGGALQSLKYHKYLTKPLSIHTRISYEYECIGVPRHFFVSLLLAGVIIPQILLISFRKNLFDEVNERKIHQGRVPRLGGIAFMPSMVFSGGEAWANDVVVPFCFGVCALMIMYLVGMADDLVGVRYSAKFIAQLVSAGFLALSGLTIDNLHGFLGIGEIPQWVAVPFTMLVVVFVTNAINLIDGIDGLASGLSSIAFLWLGASVLRTIGVCSCCVRYTWGADTVLLL